MTVCVMQRLEAVAGRANGQSSISGESLFSTLTGTSCPFGYRCLSFFGEQTMNKLDHIDQSYLDKAAQLRSKFQRPDMGDFVLFPTGQLERFSHDWDVGIQTSPGGSYYLQANGHAYLSCGGLNPKIPTNSIEELPGVTLQGRFWFFHHAQPGAGRGVYVDCACRVYKTSSPYAGFLGEGFQNPQVDALKAQIQAQIAAQGCCV